MGRNTLEIKQILEQVRTKKKLSYAQQQRLITLREETAMLDRKVKNTLSTSNGSDPKIRRMKSQYDGVHKGFVDMSKLSERVEREFYDHNEHTKPSSKRMSGMSANPMGGNPFSDGEMSQVQIMEEEEQQKHLQRQLHLQQPRQQQQMYRQQQEETWDLKEVTDLDAKLIQELNNDITEAEEELSVIADLMKDLGVEVKAQGEKMEVIEDQLYEAEEETTMAIQELERAPCCATCCCAQCCRSFFFCCKC